MLLGSRIGSLGIWTLIGNVAKASMMIIGRGENPAHARKGRRYEELRAELPPHPNHANNQRRDLCDKRNGESWQEEEAAEDQISHSGSAVLFSRVGPNMTCGPQPEAHRTNVDDDPHISALDRRNMAFSRMGCR
jgi:hypothetical protein